MLGIKFRYKDNKGQDIDIENKKPQYLYLEPKGKVVVRYYFTKAGLDVNTTKLISNVLQTDIVSVKIKKPKNAFLSSVADFDNIPDRLNNAEYFEVDFSSNDTISMDVLYESLTDSRLKIKVIDSEAPTDSFENENTVSDGPDAFVKVVGVVVRPQDVYYVYIYRRDGRLKKTPSTVEYSTLASIFKERVFNPSHPDHNLSSDSIVRGIINSGGAIDYAGHTIIKTVNGKEIIIDDIELGNIIKTYGNLRDIINLLKTEDITLSKHPLILENANYYVSCDKDCSLPEALYQNSTDERGVL